MSRDWTPIELHFADKEHGFSKNPLRLTIIPGNEEVTMYDPSDDFGKRWPNAYFLGEKLVKNNAGNPKGLDAFESALTKIVNLYDNKEHLQKDASELEKTVEKWYLGELDASFYYNTRNNELMDEYIKALSPERNAGNGNEAE